MRLVRVGVAQRIEHRATTTADEFMDATLDVWELAPESATRVGHPAPFPVELPQRLIDLYLGPLDDDAAARILHAR